ncbi:MAG: serine/threonine-protein kinase [Eubacteriales bacterium]|nr:serine/threonine-protein kinase [Eubacteriales bacterium]
MYGSDEIFSQQYETELAKLARNVQLDGLKLSVKECLQSTAGRSTFLVHFFGSGQLFVLKTTTDEHVMLQNEYELLRSCRERGDMHFPYPIACWEADGRQFMMREYIKGITLEDVYTPETQITGRRLQRIGLSLCEAVSSLHKCGVIHRDIKPRNVVLCENGRCVLMDMDTCRVYNEKLEDDTQYVGTKGYAAPEQFGYRQTDARTDIYGIGMVLLYLVTGGTRIENLKPHLLSPGYRHVIKRCIAFDPNKRYQSVAQLAHALKRRGHAAVMRWAACLLALLLLCGAWLWWHGNVNPNSFFTGLPISGRVDLNTIINAIPPGSSGELRIEGEVWIDRPLSITGDRSVVMTGSGTIAPTEDFVGNPQGELGVSNLIYIAQECELRLRGDIRITNDLSSVQLIMADGAFDADGATLRTVRGTPYCTLLLVSQTGRAALNRCTLEGVSTDTDGLWLAHGSQSDITLTDTTLSGYYQNTSGSLGGILVDGGRFRMTGGSITLDSANGGFPLFVYTRYAPDIEVSGVTMSSNGTAYPCEVGCEEAETDDPAA